MVKAISLSFTNSSRRLVCLASKWSIQSSTLFSRRILTSSNTDHARTMMRLVHVCCCWIRISAMIFLAHKGWSTLMALMLHQLRYLVQLLTPRHRMDNAPLFTVNMISTCDSSASTKIGASVHAAPPGYHHMNHVNCSRTWHAHQHCF
jgi:hypothetical protein